MDARRFNDVMKIVGAIVGGVALFGPVIAKPHASVGALVSDLLSVLPAAFGIFAAGMGTRGMGLEYQDVADAKAIAKVSMNPPAPASLPPPPTVQ